MKTILALAIAAIGLSLGGCALDVVDRGAYDRSYYTANTGYYRPGYVPNRGRYDGYAPYHRYDRRPVSYYDNRHDGIPDRYIVRPGANPRIIVRD